MASIAVFDNRNCGTPARYHGISKPTEDSTLKSRDHVMQPSSLVLQTSPSTGQVEVGDEASDTATIWNIYNEEAHEADRSMIESSHREVDVLLVFTGLFSAVLTTFIIQSYQMLASDPVDLTNELLVKLISDQTGLSQADVAAIGQGTRRVDPSNAEIRWVNGIWFSALACSLSTALISMLAKQWLHTYARDISGSPRERARKRQKRYMHFQSWHVLPVINSLPLLLHVALFLFFAGVILLLWSAEVVISSVTIVILALVCIFYAASMWIPLVVPDCPYKHPISVHLHYWFIQPKRDWYKFCYVRSNTPPKNIEWQTDNLDKRAIVANPILRELPVEPTIGDALDAAALIWLLKESHSTESVMASALQSLAGLPRDFTAYKALRQVEAEKMILERFESCFYLDTTFGADWYIKDPHAAEKYCRAWMRLSYHTSLKWPERLLVPLHILHTAGNQPEINAAAACVLVLNSLNTRSCERLLLPLLSRHVQGDYKLSWSTQQIILDTLLEVVTLWELPAAAVAEIVSHTVPLLLKLLHRINSTTPSPIRHVISLNLYALTGIFMDQEVRRDEVKRREVYAQASIGAFSEFVKTPSSYGIDDESLLDILAVELARFANTLASSPRNFSFSLLNSARSAFTILYLGDRIIGKVPESTLADILHILHPPAVSSHKDRELFAQQLLLTLKVQKHPNILVNALKLLDTLLSCPSLAVVRSFVHNDGTAILLHIANTANIDSQSQRLQMDSLRTLCTFIRSSAALYIQGDNALVAECLAPIFRTTFFPTLCTVLASTRRWMLDVSRVWGPALLVLYGVEPDHPAWRNMLQALWKYADAHQGIDGPLLCYLYRIQSLKSVSNRDGQDSYR